MTTEPTTNSYRALGLIAILLLVPAASYLYQKYQSPRGSIVIQGTTEPGSKLPAPPSSGGGTSSSAVPVPSPLPAAQDVAVHVAGEVQKPGLYHLPLRSRIDDAIKAAGGTNKNADIDSINLAALVEDGQQIRVLKHGESPAVPIQVPTRSFSGQSKSLPSSSGNSSTKPSKLTHAGDGTVNINTANAEQLQELSGVGPAMAERILEFRKTNGPFQSPEQLMDVRGIGEKKFAKMKPFVRVR